MGDSGYQSVNSHKKGADGFPDRCWHSEGLSCSEQMGLSGGRKSYGTDYEVSSGGSYHGNKLQAISDLDTGNMLVADSISPGIQSSRQEGNFEIYKKPLAAAAEHFSLPRSSEYEVSGKLCFSAGKICLQLERSDALDGPDLCVICDWIDSAGRVASSEGHSGNQTLGHRHGIHGIVFSHRGVLLFDFLPSREGKLVSSTTHEEERAVSVSETNQDVLGCTDELKCRTSKRNKRKNVSYIEIDSNDEESKDFNTPDQYQGDGLQKSRDSDTVNDRSAQSLEEEPDADWWVQENSWNRGKTGLKVKNRTLTDSEESRPKLVAVKGVEASFPLKPKTWVCPHPGCSRAYTEKCNMEGHMRVHTGEKPYKCKICGKSYHLNRLLRQHMWSHTGEKPFKCNMCGEGFIRGDKLKRHLQNHNGEKPFKCEWCSKGFIRKEHKLKHLRIHTGERPYQCDKCGRAFAVHSTLVSHQRGHAGIRDFKCGICSKTFRTSSHLKIHSTVHSGEKLHQCDICGKRFAWKDKLKRHLETHSDLRPYDCHLCTKKYRTQEKLSLHLKDHSSEKPFQCSMCEKSFARTDQFKKHQKQHAEMFQCHVCFRFLTEENRLDKHLKRHETDKRRGNNFNCHVCEKILASKESLTLHLSRIHGQEIPSSPRPTSESAKRFRCELCLKLYSRNQNLKCHIKKVHPELFQSPCLESDVHSAPHPKLELDSAEMSETSAPAVHPPHLAGVQSAPVGPSHHLQPQLRSQSHSLTQAHPFLPPSVIQVTQSPQLPGSGATQTVPTATYLVTYPSYSYSYQC